MKEKRRSLGKKLSA